MPAEVITIDKASPPVRQLRGLLIRWLQIGCLPVADRPFALFVVQELSLKAEEVPHAR